MGEQLELLQGGSVNAHDPSIRSAPYGATGNGVGAAGKGKVKGKGKGKDPSDEMADPPPQNTGGSEVASDSVLVELLPKGMDEKSVTEIFSSLVRVFAVRIVSKPRGRLTSAVVTFGTTEEAEYAVEEMNGQVPEGLSSPITLSFVDPSSFQDVPAADDQDAGAHFSPEDATGYGAGTVGKGKSKGNGKGRSDEMTQDPPTQNTGSSDVASDSVLVDRLPGGMDEKSVTEIFSSYIRVFAVRIVSKPRSRFTSTVVTFATTDEAEYAVEQFNGQVPEGWSEPISLTFVDHSGIQVVPTANV